jgi:2-oxoisovalerate dehydrogenase E1 component alpha subunit
MYCTSMLFQLMSSNPQPQHANEIRNAPIQFPNCRAAFTNDLYFTEPQNYDPIPIYRIMRNTGEIVENGNDPQLSEETLKKMYKDMTLGNTFDKIMYESQR